MARRHPGLRRGRLYLKVREGGRIVSVAAIIAVAVSTDGRREIIGLGIGPSEAEPFWSSFIKGLVRRGLTGVKLVISDAHDGLRHAITRVLSATWQRCRVHWMRNALAHVSKGQHTIVAAAIRQAFLQPDAAAARQTWRHVADQLRQRWPKLATLMDDSEHDVLAYMAFPTLHRTKLHSTNPLERLNKEVKRRADVVGIFPNEASISSPYDVANLGSAIRHFLALIPCCRRRRVETCRGRGTQPRPGRDRSRCGARQRGRSHGDPASPVRRGRRGPVAQTPPGARSPGAGRARPRVRRLLHPVRRADVRAAASGRPGAA